MKRLITLLIIIIISSNGFSQEAEKDETQQKSNIQTYTPSKLLSKGQWDIKWFNNLYTQTSSTDSGNEPRQTYFTSSIDVFTGISNSNRINVGLLAEIRSNTVSDRGALDVFKFDGDSKTARSGLTSFAPVIKFNLFKNVSNFTIQSAFHIPLIDNETENGVFLDQTAYTFQNRFFYDYTFPSGNWQIFSELNTEYNFGKDTSFANNTFVLGPGVFMSYFPSQKFTVLGFLQHQERFGDFDQSFSAFGGGAKYQITKVLNLEVLYSDIFRGRNSQGLGHSFNLGLRGLF